MTSRAAPRPIVTVKFLDWWSSDDTFALPLSPMSQDEADRAWASPNTGISAYLVQVDKAFTWNGLDNWPAWEFRGIRWDRSADPASPDLLPGETFVPGGPDMVTRMLQCAQIFEHLRDAGSAGEDESAPYERPWPEITKGYFGGLQDRLDAVQQPCCRR